MINFILSRRNIVINEILELCLENNKILQKFKDQIFKNLIKIQEIEKICKFLIYINRKNYFGIYAPLLTKDIKKKLKLDQINLTEYFKNIIPEEIYRNNYISNQDRKTYNFFFDLELESYMFFYEKKLNDFEYNINEKNLLECKKEIYSNQNVSQKHKFFEEKNVIVVKKGNDSEVIQITSLIKKIIFNEEIEKEIKNYLKNYYDLEIKILYHVLN